MRAHLLAPDWSVWRQVGLDYISRLNWSKQGLPLVLAADKFDMGENTMKVSKVKGIDLRKKGSVVVNKEEEEEEEKEVGRGSSQKSPGAKTLLLFCFVVLCYDVPEVGHGRGGPQGGKEDNQDNVGNEEEVDNEELDNEEKVDTMGRRRTMRRWSTRSPRKNHLFFNMFLYS